ncbi:MAG TPA: single-stranded DNA-binding protein [Saprospiraceae bacterium]|nr:single-stranded DNA-binding protein [Saprospiraceae bacterium]
MNNLRNHVLLIGNLGADVELTKFETGNHKARVSLATSESYKKNDEWVKETQWHRLVAWGKNAERLAASAKKGSEVAIQGKLKYRTFEDKNGQTREVTEIVINEFMVTGGRKVKEDVQEEETRPF